MSTNIFHEDIVVKYSNLVLVVIGSMLHHYNAMLIPLFWHVAFGQGLSLWNITCKLWKITCKLLKITCKLWKFSHVILSVKSVVLLRIREFLIKVEFLMCVPLWRDQVIGIPYLSSWLAGLQLVFTLRNKGRHFLHRGIYTYELSASGYQSL